MIYGHLLQRYAGLGDALLLNTIAAHLARQSGSRVLVGTNHPALFRGNDRVHLLPARSRGWGLGLGRVLVRLRLVGQAHYLEYQAGVGRQGREHILGLLGRRVGLEPPPGRPCLFLSAAELRRGQLPAGGKPWLALQSAGQTQWTRNKEWYPARFQSVALAVRPRFRLVQLGCAPDPPLTVDLDLRGRLAPRQAAAVLASCRAFIGQVGFLMHAAAAVQVPAVVLYGGFEAPWQSGYAWNVNLFTPLECSPCWLAGPCPYARRCMDVIQPKDVLDGLERLPHQASAPPQGRSSLEPCTT